MTSRYTYFVLDHWKFIRIENERGEVGEVGKGVGPIFV